MDRAGIKLNIKTFGKFAVVCGGAELSADSVRAGRMWRLLKYLITNRNAPIPTEKLIDVLWAENITADNPVKALYNLVYRLRNTLGKPFDTPPEFFTFAHNCYVWNPDAPYILDCEEFDKLVSLAEQTDDENAVELLRSAFALYDGDYLAESSSDIWVFSTANYYKRKYGEVVGRLCSIYKSSHNFEGIVEVCSRAAELDPLEERYHIALIDALIIMGNLSQAASRYEYICSLLDKELSVSPSTELLELGVRIHHNSESSGATDLSVISEQLSTADYKDMPGAYICDYTSFAKIYQLEKRALERSGQSVFLVSISFKLSNGQTPSDSICAEFSDVMHNVFLKELRRGDVVTQYSKSQQLMLLPGSTYESCEIVLNRLRKSFFAQYHGIPVGMKTSLTPVQPNLQA